MFIVQNPIPFSEIKEKYSNYYDSLVKIVVDVEKNKLGIDSEMHADIEQYFLENGSRIN